MPFFGIAPPVMEVVAFPGHEGSSQIQSVSGLDIFVLHLDPQCSQHFSFEKLCFPVLASSVMQKFLTAHLSGVL